MSVAYKINKLLITALFVKRETQESEKKVFLSLEFRNKKKSQDSLNFDLE